MIIAMFLFTLVLLAFYCIASVGIIWLICELMGWVFRVPVAIGVWFLANLIMGLIRKVVKKDDHQ